MAALWLGQREAARLEQRVRAQRQQHAGRVVLTDDTSATEYLLAVR